MPLLSVEHISDLFPAAKIKSVRRTFQNCLLEVTLPEDVSGVIKAYDTAAHYQAEKYWLETLAGHKLDFRVPKLIHADDQRLVLMMTFLVGQPLKKSTLLDQELPVFANTLKSFHQLPVPTMTKSNIRKMLALYEQNFHSARHLKAEECSLALKMSARIKNALDSFEVRSADLIHGDLNAGNILYAQAAEQPFALLDFERTGQGDVYSDLAKFVWRVLGSDALAATELLGAYLGRKPQALEREKLFCFTGIEYLAAVSYFEYRGYQEDYPFKDEAITQLALCT